MSFILARRRRRSNRAAFSYTPGTSLTSLGATFSRASTATYVDQNGIVQTASSGVARDGHYIAGVRSLLLEGQRTNVALWSSDFTNAAWTKVTATLSPGVADPAGGTNATTFTATGAAADVYQQVTMTAGADAASLWIRRRTGTGAVKLIDPAGARITQTITGTWARYSATATGGINPFVGVELATNGDAVDIWGGQIEAGSFASSDIPTTTVAVTRSADSLYFPWLYAPGPTTLFVKQVATGPTLFTGLAFVSNAANTGNRFGAIFDGSVKPEVFLTTGAAGSSASSATAVVPNDLLEMIAVLNADASTSVTAAINGGAQSTVAGAAAAGGLQASYSDTRLYINSTGSTGIGYGAYQSIKGALSAQSLATMRAL